jgi:hypothetical protein
MPSASRQHVFVCTPVPAVCRYAHGLLVAWLLLPGLFWQAVGVKQSSRLSYGVFVPPSLAAERVSQTTVCETPTRTPVADEEEQEDRPF